MPAIRRYVSGLTMVTLAVLVTATATFNFALSSRNTSFSGRVQVGVILPEQEVSLSQEPCFRIRRVKPAVDLAIEKVNKAFEGYIEIVAKFVDSQCSDTHAPLAAMKLVYSGQVHAFFGPCCKYALSPIARYTNVWGLPVLTPGGLVPAFSNKDEFPLLTRMMAPYEKLAKFLLTVFLEFSWFNISLLWHNNYLHRTLGASECDQVTDALIELLRMEGDFADPFKEIVDESLLRAFNLTAILQGIRNHSRGR